MPRARPPRPITLYLPPPEGEARSPGARDDAQPSLEVLLVAQQIAHARGHTFDIDSFLAPEQREEYLALLARERSEETDGEEGEREGEGSESIGRDATGREREGTEDGQRTPEKADESGDKSPSGSGSRSRSRSGSVGAASTSIAASLLGTRTSTPHDDEDRPAKRARLAQHASPLAQAYWRQRLDAMVGPRRSTSRSATPRVSIKHEPDEEPGASTPILPPPSPWAHSTRRHDPPPPLTPADRADIQSSASYWNHLLIQARAARGPQIDYNTKLLQYDRGSLLYYTHGQPPPATPPPPTPKELPDDLPNGTSAASVAGPSGIGATPNANGPEPSTPRSTAGNLPASGRPNSSSNTTQPTPSRQSHGPSPGLATPVGTHPHLPPSPAQGSPHPMRPPQTSPHAAAQAQAQASVQAQALALGAGERFMNPNMMMSPGPNTGGPGGPPPGAPGPGRPIPAGINPLALLGGMMPPNGPPGQFGGGPGPGPGAGPGPMLAGGGSWGERGFNAE